MTRAEDVAGTAWFSAAGVGKVLAFVHQPAVAGALAVACLSMLAFLRTPARAAPARRAWRASIPGKQHPAAFPGDGALAIGQGMRDK